MEENSTLYMQLDEAMRKKTDAFVSNVFKYNSHIIHPFLDELVRIKQEELAQLILQRQRKNV